MQLAYQLQRSVFHWFATGTLHPSVTPGRFMSEFMSVLWLSGGLLTLLAAFIEILLPPNSLVGLLVQQALFGRAANTHMTPLGMRALHALDTKCDDIFRLGKPSTCRVYWHRAAQRLCGCSRRSADWWLDGMRHWSVGLGIWLLSRVFELMGTVCSLDDPRREEVAASPFDGLAFCAAPLAILRVAATFFIILYTLAVALCARTHVLQVALERVAAMILGSVTLVGYPLLVFVPSGVIATSNSFLAALVWGVVFPAAAYILMLWEDSSRVDALTQFLQYMSHQVRAPSKAAGLALRQIQGDLLQMRHAFNHLTDLSIAQGLILQSAHSHNPAGSAVLATSWEGGRHATSNAGFAPSSPKASPAASCSSGSGSTALPSLTPPWLLPVPTRMAPAEARKAL
jgi:hypothetical protein